MPNTQIHLRPDADPLTGAEFVPVSQDTDTRKTTVADIAAMARDAGPLSGRPSASVAGRGYTYGALNDNGGTLYISDGTDWFQIAPSVNTANAGAILGSASLDSAATPIVVNSTSPFRVTELTTASFPMPAGLATVTVSRLVMTGVGASGDPTVVQIRYTKDAWSTSHLCAGDFTWRGPSPFYVESTYGAPGPGEVPREGASGGAALAPGDTVAVAVFIQRPDTTKTVTVAADPSTGIPAFVHVRA